MRPITDAKDQRLGIFPQVAEVFSGWESALTFKKVSDAITDFEDVKSTTNYDFVGVFVPMPTQMLIAKSDTQRTWKWWTLFTRTNYNIQVGDDIVDSNGLEFRVMKRSDWKNAGYYMFELVENFKERPA